MDPAFSTFRPGRGPKTLAKRRMPAPMGRGLMATPNAADNDGDEGTVGGARPVPKSKGFSRKGKNKGKGLKSRVPHDAFLRTAMSAANC